MLGVEPAKRARQRGRGRAGSRPPPASRMRSGARDIEAVILCSTCTSITRRRSWRPPRPASTCSARSRSAPRAREMETVANAVTAAGVQLGIGHERRFEPGIIDLRRPGSPPASSARPCSWKATSARTSSWRCPPTIGASRPRTPRRAAVRHRHPHLVDLSIAPAGQAEGGVGAACHARQPIRQRRHAGRHDRLQSRALAAQLTAILATPFMGRVAVSARRGWIEIRDRTHPEHPTGWDVTVMHSRQDAGDTHFLPPHPAVRDNLEAFGRAAAGEAPYPVSLRRDRTPTCAPSEAITRSAPRRQLEARVSHAAVAFQLGRCSRDFRSSRMSRPAQSQCVAHHIHVDARCTMRTAAVTACRATAPPAQSAATAAGCRGWNSPPCVYLSVVAAFACILLASWLAFGAGTEADLGSGYRHGARHRVLCLADHHAPDGDASLLSPSGNGSMISSAPPSIPPRGKLTGAQAWLQSPASSHWRWHLRR